MGNRVGTGSIPENQSMWLVCGGFLFPIISTCMYLFVEPIVSRAYSVTMRDT